LLNVQYFYIALCVQCLQSKDVEEGATPIVEEAPKKKKNTSKLRHLFSHDGITGWLIQSVRSVTLNSVQYFIETNFVLTIHDGECLVGTINANSKTLKILTVEMCVLLE